MNVVMIGPFGLHPRSTMRERALPLGRQLIARGHQVTVVMPPWQNPEYAGRRWEEDGVGVENIALPPSVPGLFYIVTALRLAKRAMALRPDVVHLFKPKAYSGLAHWLLSSVGPRRRPRLVVDEDDWEGPGGWNRLADYTVLERRFFAFQERWGLTHADAVTVASRTLESLVWAMGVSPERVFYVPNGAVSAVTRRGAGREGRAVVLLYTRFFEFPVSRVIEVFRQVRQDVPLAQLLVVGEGLFGEEALFFRLAAEAGLSVARPSSSGGKGLASPDSGLDGGDGIDIRYVGWVPSESLPLFFSQSDVAIYPFDDTLVNRTKCAVKLVDLLSAGVPVVAEAVGQNREYIRHGETGLLVEPGDVSSFAGSVVRLLEDASLRRRLGRQAARDLQERFSWCCLAETVEQAYGVPA